MTRTKAPPFPFRLSTSRCTALPRCKAASTVVHVWRDLHLWPNNWHAFDLPKVDAVHPCVGCPVVQVVEEGQR